MARISEGGLGDAEKVKRLLLAEGLRRAGKAKFAGAFARKSFDGAPEELGQGVLFVAGLPEPEHEFVQPQQGLAHVAGESFGARLALQRAAQGVGLESDGTEALAEAVVQALGEAVAVAIDRFEQIPSRETRLAGASHRPAFSRVASASSTSSSPGSKGFSK